MFRHDPPETNLSDGRRIIGIMGQSIVHGIHFIRVPMSQNFLASFETEGNYPLYRY